MNRGSSFPENMEVLVSSMIKFECGCIGLNFRRDIPKEQLIKGDAEYLIVSMCANFDAPQVGLSWRNMLDKTYVALSDEEEKEVLDRINRTIAAGERFRRFWEDMQDILPLEASKSDG